MVQYAYKAKSGPKEIITGLIQADSVEGAIAQIIQSGQTPLEVKPAGARETAAHLNRKANVPLNALAGFTRQLYDLLDAGLPLLMALDILTRQKQHPALSAMIGQMAEAVKDGASLSTAMAQHTQAFGALYVNMVKSGEMGGRLPEILNHLAKFTEKELEIRARVKSSLLYPLIILMVGALTLFVLLTFVLPRLTAMFEDFGADLPWPTRMVVALSSFFVHFWWLIIIIAGGGVYLLRQYACSAKGSRQMDELLLKLPILGEFVREVELARFARTLGVLLDSGVTILSALESTAGVMGNAVFKEEIKRVSTKVSCGSSLTQALKTSAIFPETAINIVAIGEETGNPQRGLSKLAQACDRKTQEVSETFVTILGPLVLVIVVGIVGFMVVAMLLPMFKMNMIIN